MFYKSQEVKGKVKSYAQYHILRHKYFFLYYKEIQKLLNKLSKEKTYEIIGRWTKACVRHFYWSVTSTKELLGEVKLAKFQTFLYHVINKHKALPNKLFNACHHGPIIQEKVWLTKGKKITIHSYLFQVIFKQ